jgi:hypothetical protein
MFSYLRLLISYTDATSSDITIILESLIPTYASCTTRLLHNAVLILLYHLNTLDSQVFLSTIVRQLDIAVNRVIIKPNVPGYYFTLLAWVNRVITLSAQGENNFIKYIADLVVWQATLLHRCLAEGKKGLLHSAWRRTRMSIYEVFYSKDPPYMGEMLAKTSIKILTGSKVPPFAAAIGLGLVADVAWVGRDGSANEVVESSKSAFYDFFIKEIVGSKAWIPEYVIVCAQSNHF